MDNPTGLSLIQACEGVAKPDLDPKMRAYVPSTGWGSAYVRSNSAVDSIITDKNKYGTFEGRVNLLDGRGSNNNVVEFPTQLGLSYRNMFHKDGIKLIDSTGAVKSAGMYARDNGMLVMESGGVVAHPLGSHRDFTTAPIVFQDSQGRSIHIPLIGSFDHVVAVADMVLTYVKKAVIAEKYASPNVLDLVSSFAFASMPDYFIPAFLLLKSNDYWLLSNDVGQSDDGFEYMKEVLAEPGGLRAQLKDFNYKTARKLVFTQFAQAKYDSVVVSKLIGICVSINANDARTMGITSGILGVLAACDQLDKGGLYERNSFFGSQGFVGSNNL